MDLADIDKLEKDNNDVKYLLVRQDLFDRTVDANGIKQKIPTRRLVLFRLWLQKDRPKKIRIDKGTEIAGECKKLCKAEGIHNYSTKSENKAALAGRTIRPLENILYRYTENNGYKYIQKLTHIVTTLIFRRNCLIDLIPKNVKNSDFLSI